MRRETNRRRGIVDAGRAALAAGLVLALTAGASGQPRTYKDLNDGPPEAVKSWAGAHDDWHCPPAVTRVVVSHDGKRVIAQYYCDPNYRIGKYIYCLTCCWDLARGERTILAHGPGSGRPVISPTGERFLIGDTLWTWREGAIERDDKFNLAAEKATAWAFSGDGEELLGVDEDYNLIVLRLRGGAKRRVAFHKPAEMGPGHQVEQLELSEYKGRTAANLRVGKEYAHFLTSITIKPEGARGPGQEHALTIIWRKLDAGWTYTRTMLLDLGASPGQVGQPIFGCDSAAYALELSAMTTQRISGEQGEAIDTLAIAKTTGLHAYKARGEGLAIVRHLERGKVRAIPAAGVHAFTPNGKQLIVSDVTGALRFFDVESGKIARTLRLDDRPANTVRVAALQAASAFADPAANRETLAKLIGNAARQGAQIVVAPETAVTGYADYELERVWRVGERELSDPALTGVDPRGYAETAPGPSTEYFARLARRYGIYLTVPLLEADEQTGRYYNTVVLLDPAGETAIHYRKLNPWPWAEQGWASEGTLGNPTVDTPYGRLGTLICFDIHEQAARMAELKVDTLLYSIAWVDDERSDWFERRLPEVAREGGFNIVGANWTLPKDSAAPGWYGYGQTEIIDSRGRVLAQTEEDIGEAVVIAELEIPVFGQGD